MTDDLLERLTRDLRPVKRLDVVRRLGAALTLGAMIALAGVLVLLGPRSDMASAITTSMFWVKLAYGCALAGLAAWAIERISRPAGRAAGRAAWIALPLLVMFGVAAVKLAVAAPELRHGLLMGASASLCPWRILATASPLYVALIWVMRGLAPTRLRMAGALAGLAAGGGGAAAYALHCPETSAAFVAVWYSAGIASMVIVGAVSGPRLLRW